MNFRRKVLARLFIVSSFLLFIVLDEGCGLNERFKYGKNRTEEKPQISDLYGKYEFEMQTIINTDLMHGRKSYIQLNSNGTFRAVNFPLEPDVLLRETPEKNLEKVDREIKTDDGSWKLESIGTKSNGKPMWGIVTSRCDKNLGGYFLINQKPPYKLLIVLDDPDINLVMTYKKETH